MTIRFNPDLYSGVVSGLNLNDQQQQKALQELGTGRRVNAPSDDPAATAAVINIHYQNAQNDLFTQNITTLQGKLQTADSVLNSVTTALTQAITLGVQAGDGTLSAANRATLATQIQNLTQQVLTSANTSYQGSYIFSGTNSGTPAYSGTMTYQGSASTNKVEIESGQSITVGLPGSQIFSNPAGDVFGSLANLSAAVQSGNGISTAVTQLKSALDQVGSQRTFYGSQLQQLDSAQSFLATDKIQLASQENTMVGIDLAQAETDVQKSLTQRSALLAAGGKIQTTSLMDYLK
jgi:flagellar hook-associated protein 3 FlgL